MVSEYTYCPQTDFFIERVDRDEGYDMLSFHIHHKFEIYYEIAGARRYFIEDSAYIVNAGSVVLIGENQIHKTASLGGYPFQPYCVELQPGISGKSDSCISRSGFLFFFDRRT